MRMCLLHPNRFLLALWLALTMLLLAGLTRRAAGQTTAFEVVKTSTSTSLMRILDDGKVGLGTTTPSARLHVVHATDDNAALQLSNLDTGLSAAALLIARADANNLLYLGAASAAHNGTWGALRAQRTFVWADGTGSLGLDLVANKPDGDIRLFTGGNAAGNERLRILSAGNVGIGTTTPGQRLSVAGTIESTTGGFKFPDGTTQSTAATGGSSLWTQTGSDIYYTSGNVGIGTTAPGRTLDIFSSANQSVPLDINSTHGNAVGIRMFNRQPNDGWYMATESTNGNFQLRDFGESITPLTVTQSGNVGIGTTNPAAKLEVEGYGKANTGLAAPLVVFSDRAGTLTLGGNSPFDGSGGLDSFIGVKMLTSKPFSNSEAGFIEIGQPNAAVSGHITIKPPSVQFTTAGNVIIDVAGLYTTGNIQLLGGNVGIGTASPATRLEVSSVLRLTPTDAPGTCSSTLKGSMYFDDSQGEPCFCNGTNWVEFDSGNVCT